MSARSRVSAIVTAFDRVDRTVRTLAALRQCDPSPAEILVHVDANMVACAEAIRVAAPDAVVIVSATRVGPGGGRNRLMALARQPIVASFDDDSYPADRDYFARIESLFARFSEAAIVDAAVYHANETVDAEVKTASWVADFSGGACAYRRDHYLAAGGYVPLATAYGMEEVDLAMRLHASGGRILHSSWLRVHHDTDRARHADPAVTAASVTNILLRTFLRYPVALWAVGLGQCGNRIQWLLRHSRRRGVLAGLVSAPGAAWAARAHRRPLSPASVISYLRLRRNPVVVPWR